MSNEQFKIDDNASLFNLKATFNAAMEQFAHDGAVNRAPNPNFEMVHKDSGGEDRLHGWTFTPFGGSEAGATPGDYTKTQSKITWNLDDGDGAAMAMSGRLEANDQNEFGFLVKYKTNTPIVISVESSVGMLLNNEIGQGVGYFRSGEDPETIGALSNPEATFPDIFTWMESDATTISTEKKFFLPQSITDYVTFLIPIKFTVQDIESETIELKILGLEDGTLFDMEKIVVKEGYFEREFMGAIDKISEHTRYNESSGRWEISHDGETWATLLDSSTPTASHQHSKAQVTDLDVNADISAYIDVALANGTQTDVTMSHNGAGPSIDISVDIDHSLYLDKATYDPGDDGIVDNAAQISDGGANIVTAVQARGHIDDVSIHSELNDAGTSASELWSASKLITQLATKEPSFAKNTAFNLNLGSAAGTVSEGDHSHPGVGGGFSIESIETIDPAMGTTYNRSHTGHLVIYYTMDIQGDGASSPRYDFFYNGGSVWGWTRSQNYVVWPTPSYIHQTAVAGAYSVAMSESLLGAGYGRIVIFELV